MSLRTAFTSSCENLEIGRHIQINNTPYMFSICFSTDSYSTLIKHEAQHDLQFFKQWLKLKGWTDEDLVGLGCFFFRVCALFCSFSTSMQDFKQNTEKARG